MSLLKKAVSSRIFCLLAGFMLSAHLHAQQYTTKQLQQSAEAFISKQVAIKESSKTQVKALTLDSRIPVRSCETPLLLNTNAQPPFNRQVTVQIKCGDSASWTQYVHVRIEELFPVVVSTSLVNKGELLTEQHLKLTYKAKHFVRANYLSDISPLVGSRTKRILREGSPVGLHLICMVCKGDSVTIYAKTRTLTIKTTGIALQDGNVGEQIRVKNQKSGKTISARVKDVESVEVNI